MVGIIYKLIKYASRIKLVTFISGFLLLFILKYITLLLYTTNNIFFFYSSKLNYFPLIGYIIVSILLVINKRKIRVYFYLEYNVFF